MIKKVKDTLLWTYVMEDLSGKEFVEMFYKVELQKTNQTEFKNEKVIKKKVDQLHVKGKS